MKEFKKKIIIKKITNNSIFIYKFLQPLYIFLFVNLLLISGCGNLKKNEDINICSNTKKIIFLLMFLDLEPGDFVINISNKSWGIGQIQSIINNKVTVNFENAGKKVINAKEIILEKINKIE